MDFFEKVKGIFLEPSKTFDALKEEPFSEAVKYFFILTVIYSALLTIMLAFSGPFLGQVMEKSGMVYGAVAGIDGVIKFFVNNLYSELLGIFISAAIFHTGVYIAGGKKGLNQTIRAIIYGTTPPLLLGWIPVINIIAGIWSLALYVIGIRQLHGIVNNRAIMAVIVPFIILILMTAFLTRTIFLFGMRITI